MKKRANQCTLENIQIFLKKLSRRGNEQVTKNSNRCKEKHKDKKVARLYTLACRRNVRVFNVQLNSMVIPYLQHPNNKE